MTDQKREGNQCRHAAASAEAVALRLMVAADIDAGMRLKSEANWNQTQADWQRFLALQPDGCFVAEIGGRVIGTVTTCVFGCVGWIGMLLVDASYRGRGVGRRLMERAMSFLSETGATRMRLDATEAGHPLHEKMGFRTQYKVIRFAGDPQSSDDVKLPLQPREFVAAVLTGLLSLYRTFTFVNRARLLARLVEEPSITTRVVGSAHELKGFLVERAGAQALQIGPAISGSDRVGRTLLIESFQRHA